MSKNDDEVLVRVEGVSKKFCRSLKKSLWYGVCDIASELNPFGRTAAFANSHKNLTTEDTESTTEHRGRCEMEQSQIGPKGEGAGATESKGTAGGNQLADSAAFFEGHSQAGLQMDSEKLASIRSANDSRSTLDSGLSTPPEPVLIRDIRGKKESIAPDGAGLRDGEFFAVKDVSFELRRGECLGLIGHNGAGKTTLLKMLNGLIKPDRGSITMRGRVGALIALGAGFNPILSGRENIYINGSVLGLTKKEIDAKIDEIIDFAEIREFIDMPVQSYSSGMTVRLGFAVATALDPDVLILDEVLAVGDVNFRLKCYQRISKIRAKSAIIFVSHNADQLIQICSRGVVMNSGLMLANYDIEGAISFYNNQINLNKKNNNLEKTKRSLFINCPDSFEYGDVFPINIKFYSKKIIDIFDLKIQIRDLSGTSVAEYYTRTRKCKQSLKSGENSIFIKMGPLYLKMGIYSIALAIFDRKTNEHLYWSENVKSIKSVNDISTGSAYQVPAEISISSN